MSYRSFECHHCRRIRHDRGIDFHYFNHDSCCSRYVNLCDCGRVHYKNRHHLDFDGGYRDVAFKHRDDCHCLTRHTLCDDKFNVRLRGLDGGIAFRLRQLIGCTGKFEIECGSHCRQIEGIIYHVGRDFVEIEKVDDGKHRSCKCKSRKRHKSCTCKDNKSTFIIIPLNEINLFKLVEK